MNESIVDNFLKNTNFLDRIAHVGKTLSIAGSGFLLVVVVFFALDALLALPAWLRMACNGVLATATVAFGISLTRYLIHSRFQAMRVARRVEKRLQRADNVIVNSVDLRNAKFEATSSALGAIAIERGNQLAQELSPFEIVNFRPTLQAIALALGTACFATVAWMAVPKLVERVLPRFLDPFGNHPAFSTLKFDIRMTPNEVAQGDAVVIEALLDGAYLPEAANLMLTTSDKRLATLPMIQEGTDLFRVELPNVTQDFTFTVKTSAGESDHFSVVVHPVPQVERVDVRLRFPEYTGWEEQGRNLDRREIRALVGTVVELNVLSNNNLSTSRLELTSPQETKDATLVVDLENAKRASGSFVIVNQRQMAITLLGDNGRRMTDNWQAKVHPVVDRPPQLEFQSPAEMVVAVEGWQVPVKLQAFDDIGLRSIQIFSNVARAENVDAQQNFEDFALVAGDVSPTSLPRPTFRFVEHVFDLADLGLKAGDVLTYFATASDGYPADWSGADEHTVQTKLRYIYVISNEEFLELARANADLEDFIQEVQVLLDELRELGEQRERLLSELNSLAEKLEADHSEELQRQMEQLRDMLQEFAERTGELSKELNTRADAGMLFDFEETTLQKLREITEQLANQTRLAENVNQQIPTADSTSELNQSAFDEAKQQFELEAEPFSSNREQELQQVAQDLQLMQAYLEFMQLIERLQKIIPEQQAIADRLDPIRGNNKLTADQVRTINRVGRDQDLLRFELEETIQEIAETAERHQDQLPKATESLRRIVKSINDLDVLSDQRESSRAAFAEQSAMSFQFAQSAADKLNSLQSDCESCKESVGQEIDSLDREMRIPKQQIEQGIRQLREGQRGFNIPSSPTPARNPGAHNPGQQTNRGRNGTSQDTGFSTQPYDLFGPANRHLQSSKERKHGSQTGKLESGSEFDMLLEDLMPENLTPDSQGGRRQLQSSMRGVPSTYRDHAKAYLNRLNEPQEKLEKK
ncbi:MAG TPA: hypothetical protein PKD64_15060 [Pirellulaceae bacterium]|nr:hypothetical protein [Pirellulaceae bacterium]HMO93503.1 hypothetical protein [Pirellulaceae bacterium]HMP70408.1 hypothetical protein [Pirellulaceae bacterium]